MFAVLIYTVMLLLFICGLFFVGFVLFNQLVMPEDKRPFSALVIGYPDDEMLCEKVYCAFVQINMMNFSSVNGVVVLDLGVSDEMKEKCREYVGKNDALIFCEICELETKIIERDKKL